MTNKISLTVELFFGVITFMSTLLLSDFLIEVFTGISTYILARVFWFLFGDKVLIFTKKTKTKLKGFFGNESNNIK